LAKDLSDTKDPLAKGLLPKDPWAKEAWAPEGQSREEAWAKDQDPW
jgi:hypothetical protein